MALKVRKDLLDYYTDINAKDIYNTSRMVSGFTGMIIQPNKAIVGANAFAHESGIHQDGMLKNRETYEIMIPEEVGVVKTTMVLGRHSGRHGLKARLEDLGYTLDSSELDRIYDLFTKLSDKKKEVFDDDLRTLMGDEVFKDSDYYRLEDMQVHLGTNAIPTAAIKLKIGDEIIQESATGDGPVAAVFNAFERILNKEFVIENYQVRSVTSGREALGEALLRIKADDGTYNGRGVSTDIIEASAKAFIVAINQMKKEEAVLA